MLRIDPARYAKLQPYLDQALELEGAERATWLEALRAKQPDIAFDLQVLLDELPGLDERGFLLDNPSRDALNDLGLQGQTLGPYRLESLIGRGGMGSVWLAHRVDGHYEGRVAVKLLNLALIGRGGGVERFRREGRVLARLTHPNIARILDAGVTGGGQPYLVLEYVEGSDIEHYCEEHSLSIQQRIRLFLDVLEAVGHAHTNLIVHRDIKPTNIHVTREGVVKLLDFGIAKLLEEDPQTGGDSKLTNTGMHAGLTLRYAAPEQALDAPITTATDVYALGVLLYVLLSGQHPTAVAGSSPMQHLRALLETEPTRLSDSTTVPRLKRELRGDLENVLARSLKKAPEERYASVKEFADDLRRYLNDEPVLARAENTWYRARKFVSRHRVTVGLGSIALVAILATAGIALREAGEAQAERDRALALSSRNEAVAEFLNILVTEAAATNKPVTVNEMLTRSEALARSAYRKSPEHRAAVLGMLGAYYYTTERHARAESLLREALETVKSSPDTDLRARLTCDHALTLTRLDRTPEAVVNLRSVANDPRVSARQSADCMYYLTVTYLEASDGVNGLKFGNLALERLHQAANPAPLQEALVLAMIGFAHHMNVRNDLADQFFTRSLAQFAEAGRERGPDALATLSNWAVVAAGAGDQKRALELGEREMKVIEETDPGAISPTLLFNRGRELQYVGRFAEANAAYMRCLTQAERSETPSNKVNCLLGLTSLACETGDLASADRYLATVSSIVKPEKAPDSPDAQRIRYHRALVELAHGQLAEARGDLDSVVADKDVYRIADALRIRAEVNLADGQLPAALADAERSLSMAQAAQGGIPYSNRTGLAWLMLARVLDKQNDSARAHEAFQSAATHLAHTVDAGHPLLLLAQQRAAQPPPGVLSGAGSGP